MKSPSVRVMCSGKVMKFYFPRTPAQKTLEEPKQDKKKKRIWEPEGQKKKRKDRNITVKQSDTGVRTSQDGGGRPRTQGRPLSGK